MQSRYARVSDRFKATWTEYQFVSGAWRHFLQRPLPVDLDFKPAYERIRAIGALLEGGRPHAAADSLDLVDGWLASASTKLLSADDELAPSLMRRLFEKLKRQDESIVELMIRFYLYADAVEGDRRDKLDFLFTRMGEEYVPQRAEFVARQSLELRHRLIDLVSLLNIAAPPRDEVAQLIRAVHSMREEIESVGDFDDLTDRNLLRDSRTFKHRVGDLYFDPDVLMAIVELNVVAKNRFLRLYGREEQRLLQESEKLLEHGAAIARNFGDTNPALVEELARFREFKERFDDLRAQSNIKHEVVKRLKTSMNNILAQLDRGLTAEDVDAGLPPSLFDEPKPLDHVTSRFGPDDPLIDYLLRIAGAVDMLDPEAEIEELAQLPSPRELRLEGWEIGAYQKLLGRRPPEDPEDDEELWTLYLRSSALRIKVDEEATILATTIAASVPPESDLMARARRSLDLAKELDEAFADLLQEAVYYSNRRILHQLYRSRFRLLRGFSGLWLIYDRPC